MNPLYKLQHAGQSIWLDNITRGMLDDGTLKHYIDHLAVTGLTSNPSIFNKAIEGSELYDDAIHQKTREGKSGEALFFELALDDLRRAADLFHPIHDATQTIDGWVSLEVSPLLAADAAATIESALQLHASAARPNLFIKIPGTEAGLVAIEESVFKGVPINVTLLFSSEQYIQAATAYMRGIERRLRADLDPRVASVASLFISRWDVAVQNQVAPEMRNRLGIAIAKSTYEAYRELLATPRWQTLAHAGAMPQRLLWASTGTKDPAAPDTLYIQALAAADTINTMPAATLEAFADHGLVQETVPPDGGDYRTTLAAFSRAGINQTQLSEQLQKEGTASFSKSWNELLACIERKSATLKEMRWSQGGRQ